MQRWVNKVRPHWSDWTGKATESRRRPRPYIKRKQA